jgi:hypothetical protein
MRSLLVRAASAACSAILFAALAGCADDSNPMPGASLKPHPTRDASPDTSSPPPPPADSGTDATHDSDDGGTDATRDSDGDGTPDANDCAPNDATRSTIAHDLYVDADGDGYTVGSKADRCVGSSLAGYATSSMGEDCDDTDASRWANVTAYRDEDGDGVGDGAAVQQCAGGGPLAGYASKDGDCAPGDPARWQNIPYGYRDADNDGYTVTQAGTLCAGASLPAGYPSAPNGDDCNDADPSVFAARTLYADGDGDGVGAGPALAMCVGQSISGYSDRGDDCAEGDKTSWQLLPYSYRDEDKDTFTVASSGSVCAGASLPASYLDVGNGNDCDDHDPAAHVGMTVYADTDSDGVGAGPAIALCNDGKLPAGDALTSTDCAPTDPARWQTLTYTSVDRDGDGFTAAESGTLCSGASLAPPYFAKAVGNDCDDADPNLTHWAVLYPDLDGDGAGAGKYAIMCLGASIPASYSTYGDDENDGDPAIGPLAEEDLIDLLTL